MISPFEVSNTACLCIADTTYPYLADFDIYLVVILGIKLSEGTLFLFGQAQSICALNEVDVLILCKRSVI